MPHSFYIVGVKFDILTTFPESFSAIQQSIVKRAENKGLIEIKIHNLRDFTLDKHKTTDDSPFSGGAGMLMKIEPIYAALKSLGVYPNRDSRTKVILTSAKGMLWKQSIAQDWSQNLDRIVIICGHYEGVDHRVVEHLIDGEISIGGYVLSGGEIPAMIVVDSITRLIDGALGNTLSLLDESHNEQMDAEYPQYTRPAIFKTEEGQEWGIPEILLSGDHKKIEDWKKRNSK